MKKGFLCVWLNLCARMSGWNHLKGLTLSYLWLIMKVGSALPSLWRSHTTPKWRTTTKPSNSCWKRTTRGQSSSLPTKRTYGEAHRSFWLHACSADALMTCYVKVFHLWGAALEEKLEAQIYCEPRLCLLHKQTYNNTNTRFSEDWECRWQKKQGKYCFPHTHTHTHPLCVMLIKINAGSKIFPIYKQNEEPMMYKWNPEPQWRSMKYMETCAHYL